MRCGAKRSREYCSRLIEGSNFIRKSTEIGINSPEKKTGGRVLI